MTIKILSDFDGVWTNPGEEAEGVQALMITETARMSGVELDVVAADFAIFGKIAMGTPTDHGWAPDGRITAYVDEDPFCLGNSMAGVLDGLASGALPLLGCSLGSVDGAMVPRAVDYAQVIREAGFANASTFSDHCFLQATAAFQRDHPPALVPGAKLIADRFLAMGADVVVVSNSGEEKIWLAKCGGDPCALGSRLLPAQRRALLSGARLCCQISAWRRRREHQSGGTQHLDRSPQISRSARDRKCRLRNR